MPDFIGFDDFDRIDHERRMERTTTPAIGPHRLAARQFYRATPPYSIRFEDNGTVTLRRKDYEYFEEYDPELATIWRIISTHETLEEAERRLRMICTTTLFYDREGKPVRGQRERAPRWAMPPTDGEEEAL